MKAAPTMMKRAHLPPPSSSSCLSFSASTVIPQSEAPVRSSEGSKPNHNEEDDGDDDGSPYRFHCFLAFISFHSTSSSSSSLHFSPASVLPVRNPNPNPNPKKRSWDNEREEANPMKKKKTTTTYMGPPATAPPVPLSPSSLRAAGRDEGLICGFDLKVFGKVQRRNRAAEEER